MDLRAFRQEKGEADELPLFAVPSKFRGARVYVAKLHVAEFR